MTFALQASYAWVRLYSSVHNYAVDNAFRKTSKHGASRGGESKAIPVL